jgi:hypothetical protein
MKLTRANLFIFRNDFLDRAASRRRRVRAASVRYQTSRTRVGMCRAPDRLVAKWHICPETQRLECSWSLEAIAADGQLCGGSAHMRRLSQIRKRVL